MFFSSIFAGATTRRSDDDDDATTTTTRGGDATNRDDEDLIRPAAAETPTTSSSPAADDDAEPPRCYFIVHNIAKKHNVGTIARCATAFGVRAVVLVGAKAYNTFGCKGASNHVDFLHYPSLHAAREGLTAPPHRVRKIMGVEIMDDAVAIDERPFEGSTAFIMGNEGDGLTDAQKAICDGFVYIRQHGVGTASLNVSVAASIVMHHFALWAAYPERGREGEKFVVAERRLRTAKRGVVGDAPEEVRARRAEAAAAAAADDGDAPTLEW